MQKRTIITLSIYLIIISITTFLVSSATSSSPRITFSPQIITSASWPSDGQFVQWASDPAEDGTGENWMDIDKGYSYCDGTYAYFRTTYFDTPAQEGDLDCSPGNSGACTTLVRYKIYINNLPSDGEDNGDVEFFIEDRSPGGIGNGIYELYLVHDLDDDDSFTDNFDENVGGGVKYDNGSANFVVEQQGIIDEIVGYRVLPNSTDFYIKLSSFGGTCDAYELIYETDQDENNPIDQHPTQGQGDRTEGFTPPPVPVCGDGEVNGDDQCELPSTNDNEFCSQSTNSCQGNKTGSRDSFGSCSEICQCQIDSFSFACQKGSCGATCNPGEQQVESCGFNNVGICKLGNKTRSCDDNSCNFGNFGECVGEILPGEEVCNQLDDDCDGQVDEGNVCYVPACGNGILDTNEQCDDGNLANGDGCSSICQKEFCGDNIVNNNTEQCEPPSSNNNQFCSQTQTQCFNNKTGSRDNLGFCSASCGCAYDQFDIKCVKGSCGATCNPGEQQVESCGFNNVGICKLGNKTKSCDGNSCNFGNFGECVGEILPGEEVCNQLDDDCDGKVDEGDVCKIVCGNGKLEEGEECDDGNNIGGDGCNSICQKDLVCIYDKSKPGLGVQGSPQLNQVEQAQSIGTATERFPVLLWMDPARRITYDDFNEPGRINKTILVERINNYAFEGEQISWDVFAFDKNGIEKLGDVFVSIGPVHGPGNDIEANCKINKRTDDPCAVIGETEKVKFNPQTSRWYTCTLTVETPESMYGEYFITVEAEDLDGKKSSIDENEFWFLNPVIGLNINGEIDFGDLRPGTIGYAKTLLVENNADPIGGVLLDMFISGTDFYDPINSGAKCPTSNKLELKNFRYYATSGAYSTKGNPGADSEGYRKIPYEVTGTGGKINNGRQDIIHNGKLPGGYSSGNVLSPGAELAITFKLALPEPCNGDFSSGQIMFWGEAI